MLKVGTPVTLSFYLESGQTVTHRTIVAKDTTVEELSEDFYALVSQGTVKLNTGHERQFIALTGVVGISGEVDTSA